MEPRRLLAGDILITEIMASNRSTLADQQGRSPDWIELFNDGDNTVNLGGWHLTDKRDEPMKWEFPNIDLEPGEFLVVFASGDNRRNATAELHTNFRLSSAGEYLAVVEPDAVTVSHEYQNFGRQQTDVSYGPEQTSLLTEFVGPGAKVRVLLPDSAANDIAADIWTAHDFDDNQWFERNFGIGFDADGQLNQLIDANGELFSQMLGNTSSAYVRTDFQIDQAVPELDTLDLRVNYDDGFIAYLNGVKVASRNAPEDPSWISTATREHAGEFASWSYDSSTTATGDSFTPNGDTTFEENRLKLTRGFDQTGAVWWNESVPSAKYSFSTSFTIDVHTPEILSSLEQPDADGPGGQGMAFVLQSGGPSLLGAGGNELGLGSVNAPFVAIELDTFASGLFDPDESLPTHVGINTSSDGSVARVGVPRFNGGGPGENVRYIWVEYDGLAQQMDVYFSDIDVRPETPILSTQVDLQSVFGESPDIWAGFTAATSYNSNTHEVVNWDFSTSSNELGLIAETIDISDHIGLLRAGKNVLSIHGLNADNNDDDFLLNATLTGMDVMTFEDQLKYFATPTPGDLNSGGTGPQAGPIAYAVAQQAFDEPFALEIHPPSETATIRYTADGTIPTETSRQYTGPLLISETTRIRARAYDEGFLPGAVTTQDFVRLDASLTDFEDGAFASNLPIVVLESFGDEGADLDSVNFHSAAALIYDVGNQGTVSLLDEPSFAGAVGIRRRGQDSLEWPKGQYALEFWDESINYIGAIDGGDGPDKDVSLLGLPAESDWILRGPYSDKTQLNEYIAFKLYREIGLEAPRTRLVEVFLNADGGDVEYPTDYRGTYILLEKVKIGGSPAAIENPVSHPHLGEDPGDVGGYIFKQDVAGPGDPTFFTTGHGGPALEFIFHDPDTPTSAQRDWLTAYVNQAEEVLYGDEFADPVHGYAKYLDVDSFIDHWLITEFAKDIQGFQSSEYFFINREGKIEKGPAWDYKQSFSNANYLNGGQLEGWYHDQIAGSEYHWYSRLFSDPAFENRLHKRWFELRETTFSWNYLEGLIDDSVAKLTNGSPSFDRPAPDEPSNPISRNFDRWGTVATYLWPNCFFEQGNENCAESPLTPEMAPEGHPDSYDDYIFIMKHFVQNRLTWIDNEFGRPPVFGHAGGIVPEGTQVTLSADQPGTIFYTIDGTDPRQPEETTLIFAGAEAQVLIPNENTFTDACRGTLELPNHDNCFMSPDYVLGTHGETWINGHLGVGFGDHDAINTTVGDGTGSVFLRIPFEVTATQLQQTNSVGLQLNARFDDGFTAYLWYDALNIPVEVAHVNAPGLPSAFPVDPLPFDATATAQHDGSEIVAIDLISSKEFLRVGTNYLVVQVLTADVADLFFDTELRITYKRLEVPGQIREYSGPITVDRNMILVARTFDEANNKWSSLARRPFYLNVPPIITELNYRPSEPTESEVAAGFFDNDDFEFVEVMNTGNEPFNLFGVQFTDGIEFAFGDLVLAPLERGVVVRDLAAFEFRYGADVRILGEYDGRLRNNGEHITLVGAFDDPIMDFTYRDNDPWPERADGLGGTLEMIAPIGTPIEKLGKYYSWRGSTEFGGSPGRVGLDPIGVVINEVLTHTDPPITQPDSIELFNTTEQAIDIGGWYLSDSPNFFKYQIPAGTVLDAGGYIVFDENDFNPDPLPPGSNGFALSGANGDDVWLVIPDDSRGVDSFVDEVHFQAALNGESLGRTPNGIGQLAPLGRTSLGCGNSYPRVGPLVISEFNYNPGDPSEQALAVDRELVEDDLEFIEVHNPTHDTVDLGHWQLRGGIELNFDAGTTLDPGESLVVLSFDPHKPSNANRAAAFRVHYGTSDDSQLVGGWIGQLSDSSEAIRLERSDTPPIDDPNLIPHVVEDIVLYDDRTPWPADADGDGKSLIRRAPTFFGNTVTSWHTATPTPGSVDFVGNLVDDLTGDGRLDADDIDFLLDSLRNGSTVSYLDLNQNGSVDPDDVTYLVADLMRSIPGDANLDGRVDATDLSSLGLHWNQSDCVSWSRGDFDGDGVAGPADLNILGMNWLRGFAAPAVVAAANRPAQAALPVPQGVAEVNRAFADLEIGSSWSVGERPFGGESGARDVSQDSPLHEDDSRIRRRLLARRMREHHPKSMDHSESTKADGQDQDDLATMRLMDSVFAEWKT